MIEVEIRGRLDQREYDRLKDFLARNGSHIKHMDREMFFLYDHPGYAHDPLQRTVDIRLRNTNGECEIMVKKKISIRNEGRQEISLKLKDADLGNAKEIVKAIGCSRALKILRSSDLYEYAGIEWSVVRAPKDYFFYEAERGASTSMEIESVRAELVGAAAKLGLGVFTPEEDRDFIYLLYNKVDEEVDL